MSHSSPRVLLLAFALIVSLVGLMGCDASPAGTDEGTESVAIVQTESTGSRLDVYDEIGGDFALTDQHGQPFQLADTHGQVRLLFFGFTMCPDVCPMTLSKVVQIRQLLGEDSNTLLPLFVSVDPERDTPEKLRAYLKFFDLGKTFALTGTPEEVQAVVDLFKASAVKEEADSSGNYSINHTSYLFLIDQKGKTRAFFGVSEKMGEIVAAIRELLDTSRTADHAGPKPRAAALETITKNQLGTGVGGTVDDRVEQDLKVVTGFECPRLILAGLVDQHHAGPIRPSLDIAEQMGCRAVVAGEEHFDLPRRRQQREVGITLVRGVVEHRVLG